MTRHQALALALTMPLIGGVSSALAQEAPAGAVSCHFVARAYLNIDSTGAGMAEVAGYITDIPGSPTHYSPYGRLTVSSLYPQG